MWWALGGAAISAGSQILGGYGAKKAAKQNAKNSWEQTKEDLRRLEIRQEETEQLTNARIGASGVVANSGTPEAYTDDMALEHDRQSEWLLKAGRMRRDEIRAGGQAAWYQSVLGGISTGVSAWGAATQTDTYKDTFGD